AKLQPLGVHDKAENVAVGAAAEAMIALGFGEDDERGALFAVERAQPLKVAPAALQGDTRLHHLDDPQPGFYFVDRVCVRHYLSLWLARPEPRHVEFLKFLDGEAIRHPGDI